MKIRRNDVAVVVLTRNAGGLWNRWIQAIKNQSIVAGKYLVIDSSSEDQTVSLAKHAGFDVFSIDANDFNHGGTRQLAAELCPDAKYLVYLTQDAILQDKNSLASLLTHFKDTNIALAYGRHIPRNDASTLECHARSFTYPETSSICDIDDVKTKGFKAAFSSDVYAAYRVSALRSVGGFPQRIIVSEDSYVSARLLQAGWKVKYSAESKVEHSHRYNLFQVFSRYFDIGVFQSDEKQLFESVGKPDSEGKRFVKSQIKYLTKKNFLLIPYALVQTLVKYTAYKSGKKYEYLPHWLVKNLSAQKSYWLVNRTNKPAMSLEWLYSDISETDSYNTTVPSSKQWSRQAKSSFSVSDSV